MKKVTYGNSRGADANSGVELSIITHADAPDEDLLFYKQLGVGCVELFLRDEQDQYENLAAITGRFGKAGLKVAGINSRNYWRSQDAHIHRLGLPGREKKAENFKILMRDMKKTGIPVYHMMGWQPPKSGYGSRGATRFAQGSAFDYEESQKVPRVFDRVYTDDDMWASFAFFMHEVIPAAEENGVCIGMHPNYAVPQIGGVAHIFRSFENYKKAFSLVNSDSFGILFCIGSWASGGGENGMYGDTVEAVRYFGKLDKITHVHMRNITSPLPRYTETFPDYGYVDLFEVARALKETGFQGTIVDDHVPNLTGSSAGSNAGRAYNYGYLQALMQFIRK